VAVLTHNIGQPLVARIGDETERFLDAFASDRRGNAKLGRVSADPIDYGGLLTDQPVTRAMEHQPALLLGRFGWREPHIGPCDPLADGFRIGRIVLLPLDVRLDVGRRQQSHGAAE